MKGRVTRLVRAVAIIVILEVLLIAVLLASRQASSLFLAPFDSARIAVERPQWELQECLRAELERQVPAGARYALDRDGTWQSRATALLFGHAHYVTEDQAEIILSLNTPSDRARGLANDGEASVEACAIEVSIRLND